MKVEEKLLKRLFQKRKNDLELAIIHSIKQAEAIEAKGAVVETITVTINKYRREIFDLQKLEAKLFRELTRHENKNDTRQTIR